MRRRKFLAGGTALLPVVLAGCGHPPVVLDMSEATAEDIASEVSMNPDPGDGEYRVVSSAVKNGSATRTGRYELFDRTDTVQFDGAYYEVSETPISSGEVTVYDVRIDFDPEDTTPDRGAIAFEDLPEVDRQRLAGILDENPPDNEGYDVGVDYGTAEAVGTESVFVPEQRYDVLVYEGDRYRVAVDSETVEQTQYRYDVTELAASTDAFADQVRDRYLFVLEGLSDAEREVVEEAIDGGYFEDDDAFQSVVDRLRDHDAIDLDDFYGTWLVAYEGTEYVTYAEW